MGGEVWRRALTARERQVRETAERKKKVSGRGGFSVFIQLSGSGGERTEREQRETKRTRVARQ